MHIILVYVHLNALCKLSSCYLKSVKPMFADFLTIKTIIDSKA